MSQESRSKKQRGFTIIELLIATTVFSLVLLIAVAGVVQVTRMYYRGVVQSRTQEVARTIVDEIAESIRFSSDAILPGPVLGPEINAIYDPLVDPSDASVGVMCIGSKRYTFAVDRRMDTSLPDAFYGLPPSGWPTDKRKRHVLWVDQPGAGCNGATVPAFIDTADPSYDSLLATSTAVGGRELLSQSMRLSRFAITDITEAGAPNETYRIEVGVAYGTDDLLEVDGNYKVCRPSAAGSEFCATSNLSVVVTRRLAN